MSEFAGRPRTDQRRSGPGRKKWIAAGVAVASVTAAAALAAPSADAATGACTAQSLWSGTPTGSSGTVTVANAAYDGALGAGASTSFGFVASGNSGPVTVSCAAGGATPPPVTSTTPASTATSQFRGMNWARPGDNFTTGTHVLDGLSSSDSYSTVKAKADAIYTGMASTGVNTVRLPINTQDAGTSWWNAYRGTIDAATSRGFKVILAYWEDGASSGGKVTNTSAFNTMWNTVVAAYGSNNQVYFEPMNEPHGYSSADWRNFAASWISSHSSVPKDRILVGGTGFSQDLRDLCSDSRFNGTLFSYHYYAFFYGTKTYGQWLSDFDTRLGSCASRAVMTEYGAEMDSGLNYDDANATNNFVRYLRAVTERERALGLGGVYWPGIGGKITSGKSWDHYSMYSRSGDGTDQTLTIRNSSGANRVRYGWGL
ncbi:MAG: hypothetical protein QG671_174 [Actinomycetota bacterium]|nr:hypothetical protein [Actinomycetota bacterium]